MDFASIVDALGVAASGGLTGLLGIAVSGGLQAWRSRGQRKHEIALRSMDIEQDRVEAQSAEQRAEDYAEAEAAEQQSDERVASIHADAASYSVETQTTPGQNWLLVIVDVVRGLMRPLLTGWFAWSAVQMVDYGSAAIDTEAGMMVIYLAGVSTTWWFGDRMLNKTK